MATAAVPGFAMANVASAQVSVNINISNQPAWGPVGYDYARYYYLPEYNSYYDVNSCRFMYHDRGRWITARSLPRHYGRVNLYNTYKVVINHSYAPYRDNRVHVRNYGRYKHSHNQMLIGNSRDMWYYQSKYHPRHKDWRSDYKKNGRHHKDYRDYDRNDRYDRYDRHDRHDRYDRHDGRR